MNFWGRCVVLQIALNDVHVREGERRGFSASLPDGQPGTPRTPDRNEEQPPHGNPLPSQLPPVEGDKVENLRAGGCIPYSRCVGVCTHAASCPRGDLRDYDSGAMYDHYSTVYSA